MLTHWLVRFKAYGCVDVVTLICKSIKFIILSSLWTANIFAPRMRQS